MLDTQCLILPTAYLGPISYYQALCGASSYEIEAWESFPKQTLRNRCVIAGANGPQTLTIPVCKVEHKQLTKDVRISYQATWQRQHWQALRSAYEHTPFFGYYADYFRPFYETKIEYLLDFNMELHEVVLSLLANQEPPRTWGAINDPELLRTGTWMGDKDLDRYFEGETQPYYQIFADKHGFQHNLSIVDGLFNVGTEVIR